MEQPANAFDMKKFVRILKEEMESDILANFGEAGLRHWQGAPKRHRLEQPSVVGTVKGSCGDTISISLAIDGETITAADFDTDGCASSIIAASLAATLAQGKTMDEAMDIDDHAILAAVGTFPEDDTHCAYLAAAAVREAVHRWMIHGEMGTVGKA